MSSSTNSRPAWQRNSLFAFFASLKLAVVLLAVLIVGAIAGTIYESSFDAKVARAYIYGAPWFNLWLVFLAANLAVSALSRWPWRKHHVAFLITHLGIITLLAGSLIGRIFGIEGSITLFKSDPPTNRLLVDEHQLRVRDSDGVIKGFAADFVHHPPTPQKPWDLGALASGARLSLVNYAPAIDAKLNPKPLPDGGQAALHFTIATAMMGQKLESWLLADNGQHDSFSMGLATILLKRGAAKLDKQTSRPNESSKPDQPIEIEETIFAFAKTPDQIARAVKGGSTRARIELLAPENGGKGVVSVNLQNRKWSFDVAQSLGQEVALDGTPFKMRIENFWPDFRIESGKPTTVSEQPNNPAIVVTLRGTAVPIAAPAAPENHAGENGAPQNQLTIFTADDGALTYELKSRKLGVSSGKLEIGKALSTGWADWQLTVDQVLPHATASMDFNPTTNANPAADSPDGVRVRVQQGANAFEQWVPSGWQVTMPTSPTELQVAYGWKQIQLPIGLELLDFEVQRNEGSDAPAGFKSTVRVATADGESATGQCWMNHPFSFPGAWWRTWTGLTFKMSQASWNPENLNQSTIQILRDPGWLLKWIGSLLIVVGIFLMFYVKKFRRAMSAPPAAPKTTREKSLVGAN